MRIESLKLANNLFLAPLAGITDTIFRTLAKRYGCGFVFSEMINSNGVLKGGAKLKQKLDISPLEGDVGIQIAGDDPFIMGEAARMAQDVGAKMLNINMGCPSPKVTKNLAGCALMQHPEQVRQIIAGVKKVISIPLTIKIRLGWDHTSMNYLEISKIAEAEGCSAIFMHARTKTDGFSGRARHEHIKVLKEQLTIPVIGNGDITGEETAVQMLRETNCDGIMIGRGALGQPWLFTQILRKLRNAPPYFPTLIERKKLILEQLQMSIDRYGEMQGLKLMQKHFAWYSKGLPWSSEFRHHIHIKKTISETVDFIESFFYRCESNEASVPQSSPSKILSYISHQSNSAEDNRVRIQ